MILTHYDNLKMELQKTPQTWLITGVAGFIGSNLLEALLQLNQNVIGIDNLSTGYQSNLNDALNAVSATQRNNFQFYKSDITSLEEAKKYIKNVDYIVHQAALGSVPRSIECPDKTHLNNATGNLNILIAAKEAKVKRVVYASSSAVYGDSANLPKKEEIIGNQLSPYAVSKYINELYAKTFATCYGIETIGLRYFNVFGPRQDPNGPYAAVIPRWIKALQENKPINIYGNGNTTRDFCYISNAVQANLLAATTKNPYAINQVYNIAVGEQHSLNQLYDLMIKLLGIKNNPPPIYQDYRIGDIKHSLADVSRATERLSYSPIDTLHTGLTRLLAMSAENVVL